MALCKQLYVKGVFIQLNKKIVILVNTLIITLIKEERYKQTNKEITQVYKEVVLIKIRELRDWILPNYLYKMFRLKPTK